MKYKHIDGYPNYIIFKDGRIFKEVPPFYNSSGNGKKYPRIKLIREKKGEQKMKSVIKLIAEHFIENWEEKPHVKLKDGNRQNLHSDNIEWTQIDNPGKYGDRHEAKETAYCNHLRNYYSTLDERHIEKSWMFWRTQLELRNIDEIEAALWEYFYKRCRRFTLIGNPKGLMLLYAKSAREELRNKGVEYIENFTERISGAETFI